MATSHNGKSNKLKDAFASSDEEEFTFEDNDDNAKAKKAAPAAPAPAAAAAAASAASDDDDDDDDDDAPLATLGKKKKTKDKPKPPKTSSSAAEVSSSSKASAAAATKTKKKRQLEGDDSEDDDEPIVRKKNKKKVKVARDAEEDKDDDGDDDWDTKPKAKPSKKAAAPGPSSNGGAASNKRTDRSPVRPEAVVSSSKGKKAKGAAAASHTSKGKLKSPPPPASPSRNGAAGTGKTLKALDKVERLQYAMQSFLWWNAADPPPGCQWTQLEHAGVSFPEPYEPHGIKLLYEGKPIDLTPEQEEAATFFAAMDPDGMHLGNPKTAKIFINNWFADFKATLGRGHVIKEFTKLDFGPIRSHLNEQKLIRKAITDEQRKLNKDDRNAALFRFGYAIVDGHLEKVGNYNMEPPGAFRGRGEHPKMGKLKQRVVPEQVSLNVSECAAVPPCGVPGHAWSDVRHDPRGQWLATWKENINNQSKYMQLAAQSSFKGKSDQKKYGKAALLCKHIVGIRKSYKKDLKSKDKETCQLATAVWVIDRLALRVGGEKDTDEEADTVGCCSLRVEHLHFDPNAEGGNNREIELEFLGKDSMLFKQTIDFGAAMYNDNDGMGSQVYDNLKSFCKKKKSTDEVFDSINPTLLNNHLKQFMEGLSAKVFRTYNASKTLQDELRSQEATVAWRGLTVAERVVQYNNANRQVAILCNHQRSVSKAQETQLGNIAGKLETLKKQKKQLKKILKLLTSKGDTSLIPLKKSQEKMAEEVQKELDKAKKMKDQAKTNADKIKATEQDEKAKQKKRDLAEHKFNKAHLWERVPTIDQVNKRIEQWTAKISKMELDLKHKDDNKEVSLGTSKINYMDPRITVAFCKRNEVPIDKIFSKTLRDKFNWAMAVPPEWEFNASIGQD